MPPHLRLSSPTKCFSVLDLPILPFLAPRVFRPWPKKEQCHRPHGTAQAKSRGRTDEPARQGMAHLLPIGTSIQCQGQTRPVDTHKTTVLKEAIDTGGSENGSRKSRARGRSETITQGRNTKRNTNKQCVRALRHDEIWQTTSMDSSPLDNRITYVLQSVQPNSQSRAVPQQFTHRRFKSYANRSIHPVRSRWVSLANSEAQGLAPFDRSWTMKLKQLNQKFHRHFKDPNNLDQRFVKGVKVGTSSTREFTRKLSLLNSAEIRIELSQASRDSSHRWKDIMLQALQAHPESALKILIGSCADPLPPGYAISDTLEYIVDFHFRRHRGFPDKDLEVLFRVVMKLLHQLGTYVHLTQRTVYVFLTRLNGEQAEHLYQTLVARGNSLHRNTIMHFIEVLGRHGHIDVGLQALKLLYESGADFTTPQVESLCATLLSGKHRGADATWSDSELFALMLEYGLQPNIVFYNILLQNAGDAGDSHTSWNIHDMMLENNIEPDAHTYSILLHDAKLRLDRDIIHRIFSNVKSRNIRSPIIINDLLHALFLLNEQDHQKKSPKSWPDPNPLKDMLPLYSEYFHIGPIKDIIPDKVRQYENIISHSATDKIHPTKYTLVIMMIAILRESCKPWDAPMFYEAFLKLLSEGHPDFVPLAESGFIHNAVIMELGKHPSTMELCTSVVGDMLTARSPAHLSEQWSRWSRSIQWPQWKQWCQAQENGSRQVESHKCSDPLYDPRETKVPLEAPSSVNPNSVGNTAGPSLRIGKPTVYTWSILLKVFMDHGQPHAAEKVLEMMRGRDIEPNQVTWNSLLIGYSRMQNISKVVGTVKRLEEDNVVADDITMKALDWVTDRTRLMKELERETHSKVSRDRRRRNARHQAYAIPTDNVLGHVGELADFEQARLLSTRYESSKENDVNLSMVHTVGSILPGESELKEDDFWAPVDMS